MPTYLIEKERIYFHISYNASFINEVKEIPGRIYDPISKYWNVPLNITTAPIVKNIVDKFGFISVDTEELNLCNLDELIQKKKNNIISKFESLNLLKSPRPYQWDGICYSIITKKCINGSDMGTGKTFVSIFICELEKLFPCILVVPGSVKYNWEMQWNRINPNRTISVIENSNSDFTADVLILSYGMIGIKEIIIDKNKEEKEKIELKFKELSEIKFKCIILDESQNIKDSKTLRSKALKKLVKNIEYRYALTGTVITNRPNEIINPLVIIDKFYEIFGNWKNFVYKYCDAKEGRYGMDISGASNTLELNNKLKQSCYFRIEKRDVLVDLPELTETILKVDIDNIKEYNKAENNLIEYIKENFGEIKSNSAMMAESLVLLNTLSKIATNGKYSYICEWIDNFLESSEEKLIVAGLTIDIINDLSKKYKCDKITGSVNFKKRQEIVDDFQINNKRILFMNMMTGGVGTDGLQYICQNVFIYELPWNWSSLEQLISRVERDGQIFKMSVYYMLSTTSIDEKKWDMIMNKKIVTDAVNKGKEVENVKFFKEIFDYFLKK